jgi:hemerythrin-like domain-containing protein
MKSGPALRQLTSHRAIHDGGQAQAKELTSVMIQLFHEEREKECLEAANGLLKHWEEKIIAHADAEDEGFFQELLLEGDIEKKGIYMMMRDHDLFRGIAADIKENLEKEKKVTQEIIYQFTTLIIINGQHHKGEEKYLFGQ